MASAWRYRREGSTQESRDLALEQIIQGLRDGKIEPTDEVRGPADAAWQPIENHPDLADVAEEVEPPFPRVHEEATSLDMNPLIDVCLVLLVFFILTTSYAAAVMKVIPLASVTDHKKGVPVLSPKDIKAKMVRVEAFKKAGQIVVRIENQTTDVTTAGQFDGRKLEAALLPFTKAVEPKKEMLLEARELDWGTVVRLQDHARAAGITTVTHALKMDAK